MMSLSTSESLNKSINKNSSKGSLELSFKSQMDHIENEINEAKILNNQLRKEAEKKILKLSDLDDSIARENEFYDSNSKLIDKYSQEDYNDIKSQYDDLLSQKENKLILLSDFEIIQYNNMNLQNKYDTLSMELSQLKTQINDTYDETKQNIFDSKIHLENVKKDMISKYSMQSKEDMVKTLKADATQAVANIAQISKNYKKREKQCLQLVSKQKQSFDRYNQLKIEKSLINSTNELQDQRLQTLIKQTETYETLCIELDDDINYNQREIKTMKEHIHDYEQMKLKYKSLLLELKDKQLMKQIKKEKVLQKATNLLNKCLRITNSINIPNIDDIDLSSSSNNMNSNSSQNVIDNNEIPISSRSRSSLNNNIHHKHSATSIRKSLLLLRKKGGKLKSLNLVPAYSIQTQNYGNNNNDIDYSELWQSS